MLHDPKLLLLDEPTAGVDPKARREFWEEIHALAARGISVLVSTHYMDEAERCHRLVYIAYGKLLATGTPDQILLERPSGGSGRFPGPTSRRCRRGCAGSRLSRRDRVRQYAARYRRRRSAHSRLRSRRCAATRPQPGGARRPGLETCFIDLMRDAQEVA
jgi:ABC-type multidrug transport system ATPase subunit